MSITLMSYNTLSCRKFDTHKFDFDSFAEVIRRHSADIVGLNEIRGKGIDAEYQAQAKLLAESWVIITILQRLLILTESILMGDFNVEPEDQILTHIRARLYDTAELFNRDLKSFPSDVPEIFPFVYISHPMLF